MIICICMRCSIPSVRFMLCMLFIVKRMSVDRRTFLGMGCHVCFVRVALSDLTSLTSKPLCLSHGCSYFRAYVARIASFISPHIISHLDRLTPCQTQSYHSHLPSPREQSHLVSAITSAFTSLRWSSRHQPARVQGEVYIYGFLDYLSFSPLPPTLRR